MRRFFLLFLLSGIFCWTATSISMAAPSAAPDLPKGSYEIPDHSNRTTTPVPRKLTLRDAIMLSLRYHPNVRNAEIDRVTQKYSLEAAKSAFDVQYALTGSITSTQGSGTGVTRTLGPTASLLTPIGTEFKVTGSDQNGPAGGKQGVGFLVTQPLVRGFGRAVTLKPLMDAYDAERINKLNFKKAIIDKVTAVIQAYLTLVGAENSLITQELTLKDSLNRLEQERVKVNAGQRAPADLIQIEANFAKQQVSILETKTALEKSRLALLAEIGLDPNTQITISKDVDLPDQTVPALKKASELILKNDVAYQTQLIKRAGNQRALLVAKDNLRPKVNLKAETSMGRGSAATTTNAGLTFEIPIDSNNSLKSALLQEQAKLKKEVIELQYKKWSLESDVLNQLRTMENNKQRVKMSILSRDLAKRSLDIAEKRLEFGGKSTTFETTTLRNQVITAEIDAIAAKNSYLTSIANLQQALGTTLDIWKIQVRY